MARRKKYPRLPNGYGSISFLGKGRRNPYCVREPSTENDEDGNPIKGKVICYTDTWMHGFMALTAWKAGTYTPGMEAEFDLYPETNTAAIERILADYARVTKRVEGMTFADVYRAAFDWKFSRSEASRSTLKSYENGYAKCKPLYSKVFSSLRQIDLQNILDQCDQSTATLNTITKVFNLMYRYAVANGIVSVNYATGLIVTKTEIKHGQAFTQDELDLIWTKAQTDDEYKLIAIMCFSGFRVSAYKTLEINLDEKYFRGGVKTDAGKGRYVPIHSAIYPWVKYFVDKDGHLEIWREKWALNAALKNINPEATPHWTRHTFSALCERYAVRENDRKRMLGHKVGDITNDIYGHRTVEELRTEIEKIGVPNIVQKE